MFVYFPQNMYEANVKKVAVTEIQVIDIMDRRVEQNQGGQKPKYLINKTKTCIEFLAKGYTKKATFKQWHLTNLAGLM